VKEVNVMDYKLISAKEYDKDWLYNLNKLCYKNVVTQQFGEWNENYQNDSFNNKWGNIKYEIVIFNDLKIGALSKIYIEKTLFLSEIIISPDFQNQGHGTNLLKMIIKESTDKNLKLELQVLKMNKAINLYEKLGFVKHQETDTYYKMILKK
jgi:ribosomal protein S18 acetylase RimI-like enzyme